MENYHYFSSSVISTQELKAGLKFSLSLAKKAQSTLMICINKKNNYQDLIVAMITQQACNKLYRGEFINIDGIRVNLRTPDSIKTHLHYDVVYAIHAATKVFEKLKDNYSDLIIVAEVAPTGEADHLNDWARENKSKELKLS